jgi:hypothetical protein
VTTTMPMLETCPQSISLDRAKLAAAIDALIACSEACTACADACCACEHACRDLLATMS